MCASIMDDLMENSNMTMLSTEPRKHITTLHNNNCDCPTFYLIRYRPAWEISHILSSEIWSFIWVIQSWCTTLIMINVDMYHVKCLWYLIIIVYDWLLLVITIIYQLLQWKAPSYLSSLTNVNNYITQSIKYVCMHVSIWSVLHHLLFKRRHLICNGI